jgi:UrcA family protein
VNVRLALACLAAFASLPSVTEAGSPRTPTEVRISTAGVNFSRPESVGAFYASLKRAARKACDSRIDRDLGAAAADRACAAAAVDRAVRELGEPALIALHQGIAPERATVFAANQR